MSRIYKVSLLILVVAFTLACSLISNPINNVKNTANTAQAVATQVVSVASAIPFETLGALPTAISGFTNFFDPQGTPVSDWNGVPIMPQATAGQEFEGGNYSFRFSGTVQEAHDFYVDSLGKVGWSPMLTMPGDENGALLVFQKDSSSLTITITNVDPTTSDIVVLLTLVQ